MSLFHRVPQGLELTEAGARLIAPARIMAEAAARLARIADGQAGTMQGAVRLTASTVVSHHLLPPIIAKLRQIEPLIQIELVPSDTTENLLFREAGIAMRMYRPEQLDIITRKVADIPTAFMRPRPIWTGSDGPPPWPRRCRWISSVSTGTT